MPIEMDMMQFLERNHYAMRTPVLALPYGTPEERRIYHNEYQRLRRLAGKCPPYDSAKQKGYTNKSVHGNVAAYLYRIAKHRAKKRGVTFGIEQSDVVVPKNCPVLGMELVCGVGTAGKPGGNWDSPSLDRIDNNLGYVKGNVQVISHLANSMKSVATKEQLRMFANYILETYK